MMRIELSPLEFDSSGTVRRQIPRLPDQRQPDYEAEFDFLTVFYDCFASVDGRGLVCIGPPLYSVEPAVLSALEGPFFGNDTSQLLVGHLDRHFQLRFPSNKARPTLPRGLFQQSEIQFQPNLCELFKGKRVLLSKSKDNELVWIRDWLQFHVANQNCNAVLLYDN